MTCCSHAASEHRGGRCDGWVTVDGEQVRCGCAGGVWVGRDDLAHSFDCIVEGCERCLALRSLAALGVVDDTTEPAEPEVGAIMRRLLEDGHLKLLTPTPGSSEHAAPLLLADGGVTTLDFAEADLLRELLASPLAAAPTPPPTTNVGAASSSVVDAPVPPTKTTCNQCGHDKSDHYLRMWKQAEAWANAQVKAEGLDERMAVPLRVGKYNELMREAGHVVPASEPESDA